MENLWMCINNIPAVLPLWSSLKHNDITTFLSVGFVSFMSAISHLVENHKHGMPGWINVSKNVSIITNKLDVLGSFLIITRMTYLYYNKYGIDISMLVSNWKLLLCVMMSVMCLKISEYDNQNVLIKRRYLVLHTIWHVTIYPLMFIYLESIIY